MGGVGGVPCVINISVIIEIEERWEGLVVCPVLSTYLSSLRQERDGRASGALVCPV